MSWLPHLSVVLHQVRYPDNLGAVARLMVNFGVADLRLSDPNTHHPLEDARKLAVHAEHILDAKRVFPSLPNALEDVVYSVGTTSREQVEGRPWLTPEQAATKLAEASTRGRVALVFGGEKRGLSDEEMGSCHEFAVIPTEDAQPSMNLSQAVGVMLYVCSRENAAPPARQEEPPAANMRIVQALEETMRETLLKAEFLNPSQPDLILRELVRALFRARLSQREAELWLNAFKQIRREL